MPNQLFLKYSFNYALVRMGNTFAVKLVFMGIQMNIFGQTKQNGFM